MDSHLRQSTERIVRIGPVVAVGDGFTPVTTLDVSTADEAELLKDTGGIVDISGATFAAITTADGYYDLTLTTSLTDTVGPLTVLINDDSLCLPVRHTYEVIEEAIYDAIYGTPATIAEEAQGLPPATPTLPQAIMYIYMTWRNNSQSTSTERKILNDAETVIAKGTMSDDGVSFKQGKLGSGPTSSIWIRFSGTRAARRSLVSASIIGGRPQT